MSWLGDEGSRANPKPELVVGEDGAYLAGTGGWELRNLKASDTVYTASQTKRLLSDGDFDIASVELPRYKKGKKKKTTKKTTKKKATKATNANVKKAQTKVKNAKNKKINQKNRTEIPYKRIIEENKRLLEKEAKCKENFSLLRNQNKDYKKLIKQLLDQEYKYEVTFQKVTYLDKEHTHYVDLYKNSLHRVEQESGLKNLILEKKLEILEDNLEIKEVQLKELIKRTLIDPSKINQLTSTLEEVDLMKTETIKRIRKFSSDRDWGQYHS